MDNSNPFEPPRSSLEFDQSFDGEIGVITYKYLFTAEHLIESLRRHRWQNKGRRVWFWIQSGCVAPIFVLLALFFLVASYYPVAIFLLFATMVLFFNHKIDEFFAVRGFRDSPYRNTWQTIHLSENGFQAEADISSVEFKWAVFAKAIVFDDGLLLYRSGKVVYWLPDISLEGENPQLRVRKLVAMNLPTSKAAQHLSRFSKP